jgi:hypothetical protein
MRDPDDPKGALAVRDVSHRSLLRDVILGTVAVIVVSLGVPAWIIQAEYRKTFGGPVNAIPTAEILRDATADAGIGAPPAPRILEVAERLVRREAERRATAHSPPPAGASASRRPVVAPPARAAAAPLDPSPADALWPPPSPPQSP